MIISLRRACLGFTAIALASPLLAHRFQAGALLIEHPWSRETAKGQQVGAGYLSITNKGKTADRLVSATSAAAASVEVHTVGMENGVMRMRQLKDGLPIPAGKTVTLKPGGYHIMLIGLKKPLVKGAMVPAELRFEKAGRVKIAFKIDAITASADDHANH